MVERAVAEAIDALAAPPVRAKVVALALRWSRRSDIPERGPEVGEFVFGPLYRAVEQTLGMEVALAVRAELEPVAALVADTEVSSVRPSWPNLDDEPELVVDDDEPELFVEEDAELEDELGGGFEVRRPSFPTDPAPRRELPLVIVASADPTSVARLGAALGGVAYLEPARDALGILEGIGRQRTGVIVLDCRRPSVSAETLLAMQPELPEGSRVLMWGETPALERDLEGLGAGIPAAWIRCGSDASAEDVAAICGVLLA